MVVTPRSELLCNPAKIYQSRGTEHEFALQTYLAQAALELKPHHAERDGGRDGKQPYDNKLLKATIVIVTTSVL